MPASASPSGGHGGSDPRRGGRGSGGGGGGGGDGGGGGALKHDPGLAMEWSAEEQIALERALNEHATETSILRYAKIALKFENKTVRDVALRCRWMSKKETRKKRKEENNLARKNKDKKEKVADPSAQPSANLARRPNVPPYPLPIPLIDDDDVSYQAIGGSTGELLELNAQALSQISTNLNNLQIQENIFLLSQTRDNLLRVLNEIDDVPGSLNQMPWLPVKINEDLANTILPTTTAAMQT
ncbi:translation initiation factor IF-2 isoform X1 [Ananas comosus]|uniref:Translation initiation factor IF-2 isoform X1 n=2 Tax=Ananas comosus TaxID=4615 RepID=A0A6P5GQ89_ANACO|nr:translation initiation factor IF-2 isoform X1 [Ananas comosus]